MGNWTNEPVWATAVGENGDLDITIKEGNNGDLLVAGGHLMTEAGDVGDIQGNVPHEHYGPAGEAYHTVAEHENRWPGAEDVLPHEYSEPPGAAPLGGM